MRAIRMILGPTAFIGPLNSAGRTDSGVHARGQVVAFITDSYPDLYRFGFSISGILRPNLVVKSCEYVDLAFRPLSNVAAKLYSYTILNRRGAAVLDLGRVWHISTPLSTNLLDKELQALVGTHDFTSFRAPSCAAKTPIKTIQEITVTREEEKIEISIIGKGFLRQMVRIIVGSAVERARGRLKFSLEEVLLKKDRLMAGRTAPPEGLCLEWVRYL